MTLFQLYHQENIYVVLVGIEVWTAGDNVTVSPDASKRLTNFCSYRENSINPFHNNDNAQLLTYDSCFCCQAQMPVSCLGILWPIS